MASTTFVDTTTVIYAAWLNDVNYLTYSIFNGLSAVPSAGKIFRSNGTNVVASTSTFADTYGINTLLYASAANTVAGLATANSGVLTTSAGGVPTWSTASATFPYTLGIGQGGTGQTSANAAMAALSPQTTKGDLVGFSTVPTRLAVGANGNILVADSSQSTGLGWLGTASIPLTGVVGTNTITGTSAPAITAYVAGQKFLFVPAATNTGATTLNINSLGAKTVLYKGNACSGSELIINVPTEVYYDGASFHVLGPSVGTQISAIGTNTTLVNQNVFYDGPSIAQGTIGTWFVVGSVTCQDTVGAANFGCLLYDGTTKIASGMTTSGAANFYAQVTLSGYITNPTGNLRISVFNGTRGGSAGLMVANASGQGKDLFISAIRIA